MGKMDIKNSDIMQKVKAIANELYDGHFTLMKFTTDWRFCFGTVNTREQVAQMAKGKTMEEAISRGIAGNINVYDFE